MSTTVDNIQGKVAAVVDQDQDTSNISADDYALRLTFINNREREWAEAGRWPSLYKEFITNTSTATGNVTVSLPGDFRVEAGFPRAYDGSTEYEYSVIEPQREKQYSSTDKYVKKYGNENTGHTMVFNSAGFASGSTIFVPYFSYPSSHASPANVIYCPNPEYISTGVIADVWEAGEDARFQIKKSEADQILENMLEFGMTPSEGSADDRVKVVEQTRHDFKWGRD